MTRFLCLVATIIAGAASAGPAPQDWVPPALVMPDDMAVLTDREIGSNLRMFSISTGDDADALLAIWNTALRDAGYTIIQAPGAVAERAIEFTGTGIRNGQIAVAPALIDGLSVITFDATLR